MHLNSTTRSSPGDRNVLLHINDSLKLSRTKSSVRFQQLLCFPTPKTVNSFDRGARMRGPPMSPVLLLRHSLLNSHMFTPNRNLSIKESSLAHNRCSLNIRNTVISDFVWQLSVERREHTIENTYCANLHLDLYAPEFHNQKPSRRQKYIITYEPLPKIV